MSADKYPCIFSRQMETIVYIINPREVIIILIIKITISSIVIGLRNSFFSANSLAKLSDSLLLDSLLSDSSISQSHSKLRLNQPITFKVVV